MTIYKDLKDSIEARKNDIEGRKTALKARAETAKKVQKAIKLLEACDLSLPGGGKNAITSLKEAIEDIEKMEAHHKQAIAIASDRLKAETTALKALEKGGLVND
jgi:uncharacterized protein (DUF305 family)